MARVTLLLVVLAAVVLYAVRDVAARRAGNEWARTLSVALIVVQDGAWELYRFHE